MKTKLVLVALFSCLTLFGGSVTLVWDPLPGATNFVVYASTNALNNQTLTNATVKVNVGPATGVYISQLKPGSVWNFGVTAVLGDGFQTDLSNMVSAQAPTNTPNMRVLVGQWGPVVTGITNAFFQLQIR